MYYYKYKICSIKTISTQIQDVVSVHRLILVLSSHTDFKIWYGPNLHWGKRIPQKRNISHNL